MEYVGEHLWAANLGRGLTALAFTMALLSTVAYYLKGDDWKRWVVSRLGCMQYPCLDL